MSDTRQWIQDNEILWQMHKQVTVFFAWQKTADLCIEVDDLVQDIIIRVLKNSHQFAWNKQQFKAWVARMTRNMCIDLYRSQSRKNTVHVKSVNRDSDSIAEIVADTIPVDWGKTVLDTLENVEMVDILHQAIAQLEPDQQYIIQEKIFWDKKFKKIAADLRISINTAIWRMRYALINLRKMKIINDYFQLHSWSQVLESIFNQLEKELDTQD